MQRTSIHLESLKDIPGYKAIIKAVLHSQIQQLVEQLSQHAEEEAVFLTASLGDGSIYDLGSGIGKDFLQEKDDVKSQFLRFCLKRHHMIKTDEKSGQSIEPRPVRVTRATCSPRPRHTPYVSSPRGQKRVSGGTFVTPSSSSVNIFSNDENQTESSVNEIKQESICIQLADNDDNCDNYGGGGGVVDMDDYELADEGVSDEVGDDHKHNSKLLETCMSGTERNTPQSNVVGRETLMTTQGSLDDPVDIDRDNNFTVKLEASGLHESDIKPVEMEHGVVHSETVSDMSFGTGLEQSGHHGYSGAAGTSADIQGNRIAFGNRTDTDARYMHRNSEASQEVQADIGSERTDEEDRMNYFTTENMNYSPRPTLRPFYSECAFYAIEEMLEKKEKRGKAAKAQSFFSSLIREAAEIAHIWKRAPTLAQITEHEQDSFFNAVFSVAPQLHCCRREVWQRLGQNLQNRRKYLQDKHAGKRSKSSRITGIGINNDQAVTAGPSVVINNAT